MAAPSPSVAAAPRLRQREDLPGLLPDARQRVRGVGEEPRPRARVVPQHRRPGLRRPRVRRGVRRSDGAGRWRRCARWDGWTKRSTSARTPRRWRPRCSTSDRPTWAHCALARSSRRTWPTSRATTSTLAKALPMSQGSTRDWESFLKLDPGNTIALNNLAAGYQREGWFLFRTGRVAEAIESYTAATAVEKRTRMSPSFAINQMWPAGSVVFVEADRGNFAQAEAALAHVRQLSEIAGEPRKDDVQPGDAAHVRGQLRRGDPGGQVGFRRRAQARRGRVAGRQRCRRRPAAGCSSCLVRQPQRSLSRPRLRGVHARRLPCGGSGVDEVDDLSAADSRPHARPPARRRAEPDPAGDDPGPARPAKRKRSRPWRPRSNCIATCTRARTTTT